VHLKLEVGGGPLRVCLAWTDLPRNRVQNALGFKLEHDGSRASWFGNEHRPGLRRRYDRNNNVQVVRVERAEAGRYSLFVEAGILTQGPQRFALAVTGAAGLRLEPVSVY
jgi:serine protease AprX